MISELARIAFSNITDVAEWGPAGVSLKDSEKLLKDVSAAIAEATTTETQAGRNTRVKMHDKVGALTSLARHYGLFNDKSTVTVNLPQLRDLPSETLVRIILGAEAELRDGA